MKIDPDSIVSFSYGKEKKELYPTNSLCSIFKGIKEIFLFSLYSSSFMSFVKVTMKILNF